MQLRIVSAICLCLISFLSLAKPTDKTSHPGNSQQFFAGIDVGYGFSNATAKELDNRVNNPLINNARNSVKNIKNKNTGIYDLEIGYMLTRHYGVGLDYFERFNDVKLQITNALIAGTGNATMHFNVWAPSFIVDFPIKNKFSFLGQAGFALIQSKTTFDSTAQSLVGIKKVTSSLGGLMLSASVDYAITPQWKVDLDYMHIFENKNNISTDTVSSGTQKSGMANPSIDAITAGIKYYFKF